MTTLLPSIMAAAQSGNLSIGGIISQAIAGGAGGAILTAIIGAIKTKLLSDGLHEFKVRFRIIWRKGRALAGLLRSRSGNTGPHFCGAASHNPHHTPPPLAELSRRLPRSFACAPMLLAPRLRLHILQATTERDFEMVFGRCTQLRAGGLVIGADDAILFPWSVEW